MPYLFLKYEAPSGPTDVAHMMCTATINGSALLMYQNNYHVAVACGTTDSTVDRLEDRRLTVSKPFTIQEGEIAITAPYGKEMLDYIQHLTSVETGIRSVRKRHLGIASTPVSEQFPVWYQAILLPNSGCDVSDIHRLSDVPRCGGVILPVLVTLTG
jgi:hypothetical protein